MRRLLLALLCLVTEGRAATSSTPFNVTATVIGACSVVVNPLNFGSYSPLAAVNGTTTVSVTCTSGVTYSIDLSVGNGTGAAFATGRYMMNGGSGLQYNLFQDGVYTQIWGDGTGGSLHYTALTGNGSAQNYTVYGQIPAGQAAPGGNYLDVIQATVTY